MSWRNFPTLEVLTQARVCVCVCVCARTQSCPTLCHPVDCSPPSSSVHGILQERILKRVGHFLLQGIFPDPVIEPPSLASPALAGGFFTLSTTWEAPQDCEKPITLVACIVGSGSNGSKKVKAADLCSAAFTFLEPCALFFKE